MIERAANNVKLDIYTARPGMVIGRGGSEVDSLRQYLEHKTGRKVQINVVEVETRIWMPNWWPVKEHCFTAGKESFFP